MSQTQFLAAEEGKRVAYRVDGQELAQAQAVFLLLPSLGDLKEEYCFLSPLLCDEGRTRLFRWIFAAWVKVMWAFRAMLLMIRAAIWSSLHDIWVLLRRSKANLLFS
jgi:hypothetical protein